MIKFLDLTNKNILVTGATSGIGFQTCVEIAKYGGNIIAIGRNESKLKEIKNLETTKNTVQIINYDLSDLNNLDQLISQITITLDAIIHSAGVVELQPIKFLNLNTLNKIRTINYDSIVFLISKILKKKLINKSASIVFVSSIAAENGMKGNFIYSASKAALNSSAKVFAAELAGQKIRVNTIAPGQVETPLTQEVALTVSEEAINIDKAKYPLGYGKPEDVANLALFLISDKSTWITGTTITIDGGRSNILN
jgi:NAD(P)-dependent dehydrogenase (short-subunit alcohol dehydrogenase family)